MTVGPIDATKKVCPDAVTSHEAMYLDRLAKVVGWWYDGGKLMLSYAADGNDFSQVVYEAAQ